MHFPSQIGLWPNTALELTLNYVAQRSPKVLNIDRKMTPATNSLYCVLSKPVSKHSNLLNALAVTSL